MQEYPSVWKHSDGVNKLWQKVSVKVYRPTTPSMKELFLTVVNSFTLSMVGLSVNLSQQWAFQLLARFLWFLFFIVDLFQCITLNELCTSRNQKTIHNWSGFHYSQYDCNTLKQRIFMRCFNLARSVLDLLVWTTTFLNTSIIAHWRRGGNAIPTICLSNRSIIR